MLWFFLFLLYSFSSCQFQPQPVDFQNFVLPVTPKTSIAPVPSFGQFEGSPYSDPSNMPTIIQPDLDKGSVNKKAVIPTKLLSKIMNYIQLALAENANDDDLEDLPTYKSTTDVYEFGSTVKGEQFFQKSDEIDPDAAFVRVPLLFIPSCHQLSYVRVMISRSDDGEPPMVHLDTEANQVIIGFPRRHRNRQPNKTTYNIDAYSERIPYCKEKVPPMGLP